MPTPDETQELLSENGYSGTLSKPDTAYVNGRIDLDAGPIITLYTSGKALIQGRGLDQHGNDVRALLRCAGWKVK